MITRNSIYLIFRIIVLYIWPKISCKRKISSFNTESARKVLSRDIFRSEIVYDAGFADALLRGRLTAKFKILI